MTQWQEGQLIRTTHRRFLFAEFSQGLPAALGLYDLDLGQFKVIRQFGDEPPRIGEQLTLVQRHRPHDTVAEIWITGITSGDGDEEDQVIYTFRQ